MLVLSSIFYYVLWEIIPLNSIQDVTAIPYDIQEVINHSWDDGECKYNRSAIFDKGTGGSGFGVLRIASNKTTTIEVRNIERRRGVSEYVLVGENFLIFSSNGESDPALKRMTLNITNSKIDVSGSMSDSQVIMHNAVCLWEDAFVSGANVTLRNVVISNVAFTYRDRSEKIGFSFMNSDVSITAPERGDGKRLMAFSGSFGRVWFNGAVLEQRCGFRVLFSDKAAVPTMHILGTKVHLCSECKEDMVDDSFDPGYIMFSRSFFVWGGTFTVDCGLKVVAVRHHMRVANNIHSRRWPGPLHCSE